MKEEGGKGLRETGREGNRKEEPGKTGKGGSGRVKE